MRWKFWYLVESIGLSRTKKKTRTNKLLGKWKRARLFGFKMYIILASLNLWVKGIRIRYSRFFFSQYENLSQSLNVGFVVWIFMNVFLSTFITLFILTNALNFINRPKIKTLNFFEWFWCVLPIKFCLETPNSNRVWGKIAYFENHSN